MRAFSERSKRNLATAHDDLARVAARALNISPYDFTVTEGVRSPERQAQLKASGASKTLNSKHLDKADGVIDGKGAAIDVYPFIDGKVRVDADKKVFKAIADAFKEAARIEGVKIVWGGDWKSFYDGPHFELVL